MILLVVLAMSLMVSLLPNAIVGGDVSCWVPLVTFIVVIVLGYYCW